jgi:hypothetical protein
MASGHDTVENTSRPSMRPLVQLIDTCYRFRHQATPTRVSEVSIDLEIGEIMAQTAAGLSGWMRNRHDLRG